MKILICADMFPAMIETVTRLLPEDEVRVCLQKEVPSQAPWAEVLIPAMSRLTRGSGTGPRRVHGRRRRLFDDGLRPAVQILPADTGTGRMGPSVRRSPH